MNKKEKERLTAIRKDGYLPEKLVYTDILLLLREDKKVRKLIRSILAQADDADEDDDTAETPEPEPPPRPSVWQSGSSTPSYSSAQDPLRAQLAPASDLLALVKADAELAGLWLPDGTEPEGRKLVRLVAIASQWERVLQLRDRLVERCKNAKRPATAAERQILAACLEIHNLIWTDRRAALQTADAGDSFDFNRHERALPTGHTLTAEWLPGLLNAAGQLQKKPLVAT
jgi:hypothetical protein